MTIDAIAQPAKLPPMQFYQRAIGAKFFAHGQRFTKEAISMATDGHIGYVMMAETEVVPDGEPLLLPPEEAPKWNRAKSIGRSILRQHHRNGTGQRTKTRRIDTSPGSGMMEASRLAIGAERIMANY